MTFWQVFVQHREHPRKFGEFEGTSRGLSVNAHRRGFDTFDDAAKGILDHPYPQGTACYVAEADSSEVVAARVSEMILKEESDSFVYYIGSK